MISFAMLTTASSAIANGNPIEKLFVPTTVPCLLRSDSLVCTPCVLSTTIRFALLSLLSPPYVTIIRTSLVLCAPNTRKNALLVTLSTISALKTSTTASLVRKVDSASAKHSLSFVDLQRTPKLR